MEIILLNKTYKYHKRWEIPLAFCSGNEGDASFWVSLPKYTITGLTVVKANTCSGFKHHVVQKIQPSLDLCSQQHSCIPLHPFILQSFTHSEEALMWRTAGSCVCCCVVVVLLCAQCFVHLMGATLWGSRYKQSYVNELLSISCYWMSHHVIKREALKRSRF